MKIEDFLTNNLWTWESLEKVGLSEQEKQDLLYQKAYIYYNVVTDIERSCDCNYNRGYKPPKYKNGADIVYGLLNEKSKDRFRSGITALIRDANRLKLGNRTLILYELLPLYAILNHSINRSICMGKNTHGYLEDIDTLYRSKSYHLIKQEVKLQKGFVSIIGFSPLTKKERVV